MFNAYFADVGSTIAAELQSDSVRNDKPEFRPPTVCAARFELNPATLPEPSAAVRRMSSSRAVGLDEVPILAVRRCFAVIGPLLLHIINTSIVSGIFSRDVESGLCAAPAQSWRPQSCPKLSSHFTTSGHVENRGACCVYPTEQLFDQK